jgi:hypothetical protein
MNTCRRRNNNFLYKQGFVPQVCALDHTPNVCVKINILKGGSEGLKKNESKD